MLLRKKRLRVYSHARDAVILYLGVVMIYLGEHLLTRTKNTVECTAKVLK